MWVFERQLMGTDEEDGGREREGERETGERVGSTNYKLLTIPLISQVGRASPALFKFTLFAKRKQLLPTLGSALAQSSERGSARPSRHARQQQTNERRSRTRQLPKGRDFYQTRLVLAAALFAPFTCFSGSAHFSPDNSYAGK